MPTTVRDPVSTIRRAVNRWSGQLGPGLFGLACSGGADSMALADAAIEEVGAANVVVITIEHGLQRDGAELVLAWARERGVAAVKRAVTVAKQASIEAAARDARYQAFDAIADELGLASIWLAHTARDQAETVLMRIVRGTGPAGLAGIPEQRGRFVRPLLGIGREVIDAYIAARGLPVWDDPMNADRSLFRVRVRDVLMPLLRAENPAIEDALCRLAASAREWTDAIDAQAEPHAQFPIAVHKRALAIALERAGVGFDASHLEAIEALSRTGAGVDLPGGRIERVYGRLVLVHPAAELRLWRAGDRMRPARLNGRSRKLSDLFIDAKVPRELRKVARVLVRDGEIVWAEHIGPAFGFDENRLGDPR
ncbi:MAG: tRNA lysidine(34) synthetase TilS [Deltaproteobacteria bacterium]|nr:tRNA lysidine(34) synthetase TilS [Deltaproteobacteria bacterium]